MTIKKYNFGISIAFSCSSDFLVFHKLFIRVSFLKEDTIVSSQNVLKVWNASLFCRGVFHNSSKLFKCIYCFLHFDKQVSVNWAYKVHFPTFQAKLLEKQAARLIRFRSDKVRLFNFQFTKLKFIKLVIIIQAKIHFGFQFENES